MRGSKVTLFVLIKVPEVDDGPIPDDDKDGTLLEDGQLDECPEPFKSELGFLDHR